MHYWNMSNLWLIPITKMKVKSYFISIHPEVYTIIGHISPGRIHLCFLAPVFSESFLSPRSSPRMGLVNWHVLHDGGFQSISGWWRTEQWGNKEESMKVFRSITSIKSACQIRRYIYNQKYNIRPPFHISLIGTLISSGYGYLKNS